MVAESVSTRIVLSKQELKDRSLFENGSNEVTDICFKIDDHSQKFAAYSDLSFVVTMPAALFTTATTAIERAPALAVGLGVVFLSIVLYVMCTNQIMFLRRHGQKHALNGLTYFIWISTGFFMFATKQEIMTSLVFDSVLGVLGTNLALSAAYEFQHKNVVNVASGTLDEHATVTYNEMIEHSFYQGLNLVQAWYLHAVTTETSVPNRMLYMFLVTSPWLLRGLFPVHSFSDNYNKNDTKSTTFIRVMYRIKKYQYVFYKHFLLHGLNLSVAIYGYGLAKTDEFRLYWLLLNLSYVMEFFLQTLVKKKYMNQQTMLNLQMVLMTAATIAALYVLQYVSIAVALLSVFLNFTNRGHDVFNTMAILVAFIA